MSEVGKKRRREEGGGRREEGGGNFEISVFTYKRDISFLSFLILNVFNFLLKNNIYNKKQKSRKLKNLHEFIFL